MKTLAGGWAGKGFLCSLLIVSCGSKGIIQADPWVQKVALLVCRAEAGVCLDILENAFDIDVQG